MQVLTYVGLNPAKLKSKFDKVCAAIERDDFRSVDMKKMPPTPYYRAKLDDASRLLVQFVRYKDTTACLALEIIAHHAYEKSRFLRGAHVDITQIEEPPETATPEQIGGDAETVRYLHPGRTQFHLLDRPLSFDDTQEAIYTMPPPLVLVGSAGSGKTALTLEKMRQTEGQVLYVTQSPWLAQSARSLYTAHGYDNPKQEVTFLSYREFLETLHVPPGREVTYTAFQGWFSRHQQNYRFTDAHPCFEEFRGVISSQPEGVLTREAYLELGTRQSIFEPEQREAIYALFEKYQAWLKETHQFDSNLIAHQWQERAQPTYDFVVVDEVQDLTNVQLALVLRSLKTAGQFLLCGDSNQIVHPNFFSWSAVKSLFWRDPTLAERQALSVLTVNYRNASHITRVANTLLKIKHARFGSIDRESNHLVQAASGIQGHVHLLADKENIVRDLDKRTRASVQFAVLVLRDEDKSEARSVFRTPLVFSVHEAKGLEYPNIILYRFISGQRQAYAEICEGVNSADLQNDTLEYRRAKDKHDRSLELWKFYVNALYVAITRAVEQLFVIESDTRHPLLELLDVHDSGENIQVQVAESSRADWEREAHRLELQGKREQADSIRESVLKNRAVPWPVWNEEWLQTTLPQAYDAKSISAKPRQQFFDFTLWHQMDGHIENLRSRMKLPQNTQVFSVFQIDEVLLNARQALETRWLAPYAKKNFKEILGQCDQYGVDHRHTCHATPLMLAAASGNIPLVEALLERGADTEQRDMFGHTALSFALNQATRNAHYASGPLDAIFDLVAPAAVDVQVDEKLVRLTRHQGEYLLFQLMLAELKTLHSTTFNDKKDAVWRLKGFNATYLMRNIDYFPLSLWPAERRKRTYFNGVLARAEVQSSYRPARKLWLRMDNGYYMPNPELFLRVRDAHGQEQWQPIYDILQLNTIEAGMSKHGMLHYHYRELCVLARRAGRQAGMLED